VTEVRYTRADLLRLAALAAGGAALSGVAGFAASCSSEDEASVVATARASPAPFPIHLAVVHGPDPAAITKAAIGAIGGIGRFVHKGDDVIVKPNICTAYRQPELAATTNPTVVAAIVSLCRQAGAERVRVMDYTNVGRTGEAYRTSGIGAAAESAGASMEVMSRVKFAQFDIPQGRDLTRWPIYSDIMKADVVINVPIPKNHEASVLTLGGKNLMGVVADRAQMHPNLAQRIADIISVVRPTLTVIDAVRIMVRGGPTGGSLDYVRQLNTVMASHDIVAADARSAMLFGLTGNDIPYVKAAAAMGLGTIDLGTVRTKEMRIA
jgi:uncharacterized protein (DUF362 family)